VYAFPALSDKPARQRWCVKGELRCLNFRRGRYPAPCYIRDGTEVLMRLLIAFFLPWLTFFTIGRPVAGLICLVLQITLIGWIPATIWAVYALSQFKTDRKIARAMGQRP
jgi:uncharacterized membrane protein YqaE (UPF0057 family)